MESTRRYSFQPPKHAGRAAHEVHFLSALYSTCHFNLNLGVFGYALHSLLKEIATGENPPHPVYRNHGGELRPELVRPGDELR